MKLKFVCEFHALITVVCECRIRNYSQIMYNFRLTQLTIMFHATHYDNSTFIMWVIKRVCIQRGFCEYCELPLQLCIKYNR